MKTLTNTNLLRAWARLGVLLNVRPGPADPDLERVLLETARQISTNARLYPLAVTWLSSYSGFIARHRLRRLITTELEIEHQPALGLLLESAIEHGAVGELVIANEVCRPAREPGPLFEVHRRNARLAALAERNASDRSRRWGVWAPEVQRKPDALRPVGWILQRNPSYHDRIVRKGDLRASIIEVLRRDVEDAAVRSESELARLCGATRAAVRKAIDALVLEGCLTRDVKRENNRDQPVALRTAA